MHFGINVAGASMGSGKRWSMALAALAVMGAGACGNNDNNSTVPLLATTITTNAATNAQTGVVGTALAQPVGVIVADQNGAPLANATVNWAVTAGGGSVASATSVTDASGNATVVWTLGTTVGTDSLHGVDRRRRETRFIAATATAAAASAVHVTSADTLTVTAGTTTAPLVVKVVDQFGNRDRRCDGDVGGDRRWNAERHDVDDGCDRLDPSDSDDGCGARELYGDRYVRHPHSGHVHDHRDVVGPIPSGVRGAGVRRSAAPRAPPRANAENGARGRPTRCRRTCCRQGTASRRLSGSRRASSFRCSATRCRTAPHRECARESTRR